MFIIIAPVFILVSAVMLIIGIWYRRVSVLLILNLLWWSGAFVSGYFTWLAWVDRGYSENWATIGFMFFSLPYIMLTGFLLSIQVLCIRNWEYNQAKVVRRVSDSLFLFLIVQAIAGVISAV